MLQLINCIKFIGCKIAVTVFHILTLKILIFSRGNFFHLELILIKFLMQYQELMIDSLLLISFDKCPFISLNLCFLFIECLFIIIVIVLLLINSCFLL